MHLVLAAAAAAAKLLQSCPTLWDSIDSSPPGSPIPGILQAKTLEWVAISFSNAQKWKVKVKSLSHVQLLATPWTTALQAPLFMWFFQARILEWGAIAFSGKHPSSSKSLPSFNTIDPFNFNHSDWCLVVFHCDFNLHFPNE